MRQVQCKYFGNDNAQYFHEIVVNAIRRSIENANLFLDVKIPTDQQLNNLCEEICEKLELLDDDHVPSNTSHEVIDADETA